MSKDDALASRQTELEKARAIGRKVRGGRGGKKEHDHELATILDAMDLEFGKPNKIAQAWAKRVLKRALRGTRTT